MDLHSKDLPECKVYPDTKVQGFCFGLFCCFLVFWFFLKSYDENHFFFKSKSDAFRDGLLFVAPFSSARNSSPLSCQHCVLAPQASEGTG